MLDSSCNWLRRLLGGAWVSSHLQDAFPCLPGMGCTCLGELRVEEVSYPPGAGALQHLPGGLWLSRYFGACNSREVFHVSWFPWNPRYSLGRILFQLYGGLQPGLEEIYFDKDLG